MTGPWRSSAGDKPPADDTAESNLMALQAMATLENIGKFGKKGLPPELAAKMPPGLITQIDAAEKAFAHSRSKDAAVMSHDVPGGNMGDGSPFSIDNNLHFFSHAYLTASLVKEHGVNPWQAEAMSGFVGSQYELADYSLKEGSGNSGLKDILSNAEGAAFGTALVGTPRTALPGKFEGAPVENRSHADFPSLSALPPDAASTSKEAQDLSKSGLFWSTIQGTLGRKIDQDVKQQGDTGIPPAPSPHEPY